MNQYCTNAQHLANLWHIFINNPANNICTSKLTSASVLDVNILRIIGTDGQVTVGHIGNVLSTPPSTLSSALKRLEKNGLIHRTMCLRDLRSYSVELTHEGKSELELHNHHELAIMSAMLERLDSLEEQEQLLFLLDKLTKEKS